MNVPTDVRMLMAEKGVTSPAVQENLWPLIIARFAFVRNEKKQEDILQCYYSAVSRRWPQLRAYSLCGKTSASKPDEECSSRSGPAKNNLSSYKENL